MKHRRSHKLMTEESFKGLKALTDSGLPIKKISELMERGIGTIKNVKESKDFSEYHARIVAFTKKYHKPTNGVHEIESKTSSTLKYEARYEVKLLNRLDTIISILSKERNQAVA